MPKYYLGVLKILIRVNNFYRNNFIKGTYIFEKWVDGKYSFQLYSVGQKKTT